MCRRGTGPGLCTRVSLPVIAAVLLFLFATTILPHELPARGAEISKPTDRGANVDARDALPFGFHRLPEQDLFEGQGQNYSVTVSHEAVVISAGEKISVRYRGASRSAKAEALQPLRTRFNFILGSDPQKWQIGRRAYGRVRYAGIYPGIDVEFYGKDGEIEHDFTIAPGASASEIKLAVEGAHGIRKDANGNVVLELESGDMQLVRPVAYQVIEGVRRPVDAQFKLRGKTLGFAVGSYDRRYALTIDPVLNWSTYLGGATNATQASATVVDASGNVYVAGSAGSQFGTTKVTTDAGAGTDIFVAQFPAGSSASTGSGSQPNWITFYGGSGTDMAAAMQLDASRVFITGTTANSSTSDFPVSSSGTVTTTPASGKTAGYLVALNQADGTQNYATVLADAAGNVTPTSMALVKTSATVDELYVGGYLTNGSGTSTLASASGSYANTFSGTTDGFVVHVNYDASGTNPAGTLMYGTLLQPGSSGNLKVNAVQVASASAIYVGGTADNKIPAKDPGTPPCNTSTVLATANSDGFVLDINPGVATCQQIVWSNLLGEKNGSTTTINSVVTDSSFVYATGKTTANPASFGNGSVGTPPTGLATTLQDSSCIGCGDAFLAKLNPASSGTVSWFGYLGGSKADVGNSIISDGSGNLIVAGSTQSSNFPKSSALSSSLSGTQDGFVSIVSVTSGVLFSTFLGGSGTDSANGLALVSISPITAVVAGDTTSSGFPSNSVAFQTAPNGSATDSATLTQFSYNNASGNSFTVTPSTITAGVLSGTSHPSSIDFFTITPAASGTSTNVTLDLPTPTLSSNPALTVSITNAGNCTTTTAGSTCQLASFSGASSDIVVQGSLPASDECSDPCTSKTINYVATIGSAEGMTTTSTTTITVVPVTDVALTMSGPTSAVALSGTVNLVLTLTNSGTNTATGIQVDDTLPTNFAVDSVPGSCNTGTPGHVICAGISLAPSGSTMLTITGHFPTTALDNVTAQTSATNSATISSNGFVNTDSNTSASVMFTLERMIDLDLTEPGAALAATGTAAIGGTIKYTFKVLNNGPNDAVNAVVKLSLGTAVLTVGQTVPALVNSVAQNCTASSTTEIDCTIPSIQSTKNVPVEIDLAAPETTALAGGTTSDTLTANLAVASGTNGPNVDTTASNNTDSKTASTMIQRQVDLDVSQAAASFAGTTGPTPIGSLITYTFNVKNNGPDKALTSRADLHFSQAVVPGTLDASTTAGCSVTDTSHIDCTFTNLASGASASFTVAFVAPETATLAGGTKSDTLTATLSVSTTTGIDSNSANDTDGSPVTTTIDREADLDVSQAKSSFAGTTGPVDIGDALTYTLNVTNNGPDKALNVAVVLALTPGPVPASLGSGTTAGCFMKDATHVECNLASLNAGASSPLKVVLAAPETTNLAGGSASDTLTGQLRVSSTSVNDNTSGNNTDATTVSTTIQRQADLDVSHAVSAFSGTGGTVSIGSLLTYTFNVKNDGPQKALNVVATVNFPAGGLTSLDASSTSGCVVANSTHVTCTVASLNAGATTPFTVAFLAPETTNLLTNQTDTYTAALSVTSASVVDSVSGNNSDPTVLSTTIQRQADLDVTQATAGFTGPAGPIAIGTTMTYTFNVGNKGPDRAVNAVAHVMFSSGPVPSSFTGATSSGCARVSTTQIDCTIASIPANGSSSVTLGFAAPTTTNLNSAATDAEVANLSVSSTATFDSNTANDANASPVSTTIQRQVDLDVSQATSGFTATSTPVAIGGTITYNFSIGNNGPNTALNAVAKLMFSPGSVPASLGATTSLGCTRASSTEVDCAISSIASGATTPLIVAFAAPETANLAGGSVSDNWAANLSVTSTGNIDTNGANDSNPNTLTTVIRRVADLTMKTVSSNAPVTIGSPLTITSVIQNNGPDDALGVTVQYTLSSSFTLNSQTFGAGNCNQVANTLTCTVGSLKVSDGQQTYSITVVPDTTLVANNSSTGTLTTTAKVSSTQVYDDGTGGAPGANNSGSTNSTIQRSAKLSVSVGGPATANLDDVVSYVFTVGSDPTSVNTATNLTLTTAFPAGFHVSGTAVSPPTFTCATDGSGCSGNSLPKGQSFTYTVTGTYPQSDPNALAGGVASASKAVSSAVTAAVVDTVTNGGPAATTLQRRADLVLSSLTDNSPLSLSVPLKLTTGLHNNGPDDSNGLVVTYTVPTANFTLNAAGTTYPVGACVQAAAVITCSVSSLKAGIANDVTVVLAVNVDPAALNANVSNVMLTTSATISSTSVVDDGTNGGPGANNTKSVNSNIQRQSDLTVTAVSDSSPAPLAGPLQYSASVKNSGPDDATGVVVAFTLPNASYSMTGSSVVGCTQAANTVSCPVGSLTANATGSYTVTVTPDPNAVPVNSPSATIANSMTATISSSNVVDPNTTNNSVTLASTTLNRYTRLSISKHASSPAPGTFSPLGTPVSYEIDVAGATSTSTNLSTSAVSGVLVDEVLPASFTSATLDSSSDAGWSCDFTMHPNCKYSGTLAPGGTTKLIVDGKYVDDPVLVSLPGGGGYSPGTGSSGNVTASVATPNSSNPDPIASVSTHTDLARVVVVSVAVGSSPAAPNYASLGTDVTYTLTASNGTSFSYGTGTAQASTASGLFIDVAVPSDFVSGRVDPSSSAGWSCLPADFSSSPVHCTQSNALAPGSSSTLVIKGQYTDDTTKTVLSGGRGAISISATPGLSASEETASAPFTALTASTNVERLIHLTSTAVSSPAVGTFADLGTGVSYTYVVTNAASTQGIATNTASGVGVSISLPSNFVSPQTASSNWSCNFGVSPATCTYGKTLASGADADTLVITGSYADDPIATVLPGGGSYAAGTGNVAVSANLTAASAYDPAPTAAGTGTDVRRNVQLSLTQTAPSIEPVALNQPITYAIQAGNSTGLNTASNVVVTDTLPSGFIYNSAAGSGWNCGAPVNGVLTCTVAAIAPGATAPTLTISGAYDLALDLAGFGQATKTNTATISSTASFDTLAGTKTTSVNSTVQRLSDLTLAMTATPALTAAGANIPAPATYVLTVSNSGTNSVTSASDPKAVKVDFPFPLGSSFTVTSATGAGASPVTCDTTTTALHVICTYQTQAAAATVITIKGQFDGTSAGLQGLATATTTATVTTADAIDSMANNNAATATVKIVNTPTGANVTPFLTNNGNPITVIYPQVTGVGVTSQSTTQTAPAGFREPAIDYPTVDYGTAMPTYLLVTTDATAPPLYTAPVTVCAAYGKIQTFLKPERIRVFDSSGRDITMKLDATTVCGSASTVSPGAFTVREPKNTAPLAKAAATQVVSGKLATNQFRLDASGSTDADTHQICNGSPAPPSVAAQYCGDTITYVWSGPVGMNPTDGTNIIKQVVAPNADGTIGIPSQVTGTFPLGISTVKLTVTDQAGASSTDTVSVVVSSFSLSTTNQSATISAGQQTSFQVVPLDTDANPLAFSGQMMLACTGTRDSDGTNLTANLITCSLSPGQIIQGAFANALIVTTGPAHARLQTPGRGNWTMAALAFTACMPFGFVLLPGAGRKAKWILSIFALGLVVLLASCGGGGSKSTPPPAAGASTPTGTYTITISGSAAGAISTSTFKLTVK